MKIFTYDQFTFPLPTGHRFPAEKYRLLREAVEAAGVVPPEHVIVPTPATTNQLQRAHGDDYLAKVENGRLSPQEIRQIGLPWSPELVVRCKHSVGATIAACRVALQEGIAATLGGGTHHASWNEGQGFCIYNDTAVAARTMQAEGRVRRVAVIDCDVHQGNGTAQITAGDDSIFTFSIHAEKNFPFRKVPSDLDIALPDDTEDAPYLAALTQGVAQTLARSQPDLVIYLAGADVFAGDRLGRLCLTKAGIGERDRLVLSRCREAGLPVAVTMAGGYGRSIQDTVAIQLQTIQIAAG
ncbi:MAG: histone deacetylase [Anaerolineae bacterium]|nr:histone deacetylase [Anaerolineae bacterium]